MSLKEITPKEFMCGSGGCCPAVFDDGDGYVIIGKVVPAATIEALKGRVAGDEFVVKVPKGMIDQL